MATLSRQRFSFLMLVRKRLTTSSLSILRYRPISSANTVHAEAKGDKDVKADKDVSRAETDIATTQRGDVVDKEAKAEKTGFRGPFQRIKESHEKLVRESGGAFIAPNNLDKVALLWSGKYATPEEIPPLISAKEQARADDKMRSLIVIWMMTTITVTFLTMIKLGQHRLKWSHEQITKKQREIWAKRAAAGKGSKADLS